MRVYTPCLSEVGFFFAIINKFEFRSTSIFDHPPLFMKSGLVLLSDVMQFSGKYSSTSMDQDMWPALGKGDISRKIPIAS